MAARDLLRALVGLAETMGIEVRTEPFERQALAGGGLCSVRGRRVILVDARRPVVERVAVLADALGRLDLSAFPLDAKVSIAIADARARRRWEMERHRNRRRRRTFDGATPLARLKPGVRTARPR